jgi:hypothetical protein
MSVSARGAVGARRRSPQLHGLSCGLPAAPGRAAAAPGQSTIPVRKPSCGLPCQGPQTPALLSLSIRARPRPTAHPTPLPPLPLVACTYTYPAHPPTSGCPAPRGGATKKLTKRPLQKRRPKPGPAPTHAVRRPNGRPKRPLAPQAPLCGGASAPAPPSLAPGGARRLISRLRGPPRACTGLHPHKRARQRPPQRGTHSLSHPLAPHRPTSRPPPTIPAAPARVFPSPPLPYAAPRPHSNRRGASLQPRPAAARRRTPPPPLPTRHGLDLIPCPERPATSAPGRRLLRRGGGARARPSARTLLAARQGEARQARPRKHLGGGALSPAAAAHCQTAARGAGRRALGGPAGAAPQRCGRAGALERAGRLSRGAPPGSI